MKLYLVRHGKAEDSVDASGERPLSQRGMADVEAQAKFLDNAGVRVTNIYHSGKLRARQTAEILSALVAPGVALQKIDNITPMDDTTYLAQQIQSWNTDTMVCGHNPFMERMAARLLAGNDEASAVMVKTGTVMCFEKFSDTWVMNWMVVPCLTRDIEY
ncbi:MAG: phosphohistidine phosphatase SixA [Rhodospirillaceae bacterium]|nr:phosphohistidine phosphatase SixA [Rhodospirillaceae bacterium]